ncbi:hypothetical protein BGZ94_008852, partial [Podila epigama]
MKAAPLTAKAGLEIVKNEYSLLAKGSSTTAPRKQQRQQEEEAVTTISKPNKSSSSLQEVVSEWSPSSGGSTLSSTSSSRKASVSSEYSSASTTVALIKLRVCDHYEKCDDAETLEQARTLCLIPKFDEHASVQIAQLYLDTLVERGIHYFLKTLIIDRAAVMSKHMDEDRLPPNAEFQDKVLRILILMQFLYYSCEFVIRPPFLGSSHRKTIACICGCQYSPSTREKALEASKMMKKMQACEFGDVNEAGRKVDCLFMMDGVELSNIEMKHAETSARDLAIQNRKNVRLARCIQEAHIKYGIKDPAILMADVFEIVGFVGMFYQVAKMDVIAVAGQVTPTVVHLPTTSEELEVFLEGTSLGIIWNFMEHLEKQGPSVVRAKKRYDLRQNMDSFTS